MRKQRGMTQVCEKEVIEQREIGEGMGRRTKANSGSMGNRRHRSRTGQIRVIDGPQ
jgi:hypothetical protein